MKAIHAATLSLVACAAITGCGGGGNSTPPAAFEGVYTGNLVLEVASQMTLVALENGDTWFDGPGVGVQRAPFASLGSSGGGVVVAVRNGDHATMTQLTPPRYTYEQPADVGALAGTWRDAENSSGGSVGTWQIGAGKVSASQAVVIFGAASGAAPSTSTCDVEGTLSPRASGRNVFDLAWRFSGAGCALSGEEHRGIAVQYSTPGNFGSPTGPWLALMATGTSGSYSRVRLTR